MPEYQTESSDNSSSLVGDLEEKDSWIYLYGSLALQQALSLGYPCEDKYLQERIALEYPGFMRYAGATSTDLFKKVDTPSPDAIAQVVYWDDAYVGKGIPLILHGNNRLDICKQIRADRQEVIVVPNYLGKYTIIKEVNYSNKHFMDSIDLQVHQIDRKYLSGFLSGAIVCAVAILVTQVSVIQLGFIITMVLLLFYWARTHQI